MTKQYYVIYFFLLVLLSGCATYIPQYKKSKQQDLPTSQAASKVAHSFYLIGDAGGAGSSGSTDALLALKKVLDTAKTKKSYTIFLGDNIYEDGLPSKKDPTRDDAEHKLQMQLAAVKDSRGKVLFIPGNHDWKSNGLKGLKRQEEYIEKALKDKNAFQPEKGCPIENISVSEDIELILIDTQWYLANWDKHPTINDKCEIKTRNEFFLEIEGIFKKQNEKTIIVAMHHPMFTNGIHGGAYAADKHLFPFQSKIPLPGIATIINQIRGQGGISIQDRSNMRYNQLMKRLATLAADTNKAIFVSGHEHSLQYIDHNGIKQIVSGAGAKNSAARLGEDGLFTYGGQGFAVLDVLNDGRSQVRYFSAKDGIPELLYTQTVHKGTPSYDITGLSNDFDRVTSTSAYAKIATDKGKSYAKFWGEHYRDVYGTEINVPVLTLDTLMGGITIDRKGGGHQTRSLRLVTKDNRNYALRAVKKSAVQFLQSVVFKDNFVQEEFRDTFTEEVILDFYTASHPYASLAMGTLSDAVGIYHTNPQLVWMPKHKALGKYNETYGDELYILEERPDDGFLDVPSLGLADAIESTSDMLKKLRKEETYSVDHNAYVKARLFDMLLGDWDRHADQWRWARFDDNGRKVYRPIPRDRDQVFSNYDGTLLDLLKTFVPASRQFQEYAADLKDVKWINIAGSKLDHAIIPNATKEVWLEQAKYIQENLTDEAIDKAFEAFPIEVQNERLMEVKAMLKARRKTLFDIAERYANHLHKLVIIKGTDKDDHFEITREKEGTRVQVSRIKNGKVMEPFIDRLIDSEHTDEIWIYGLDDRDHFRVSGKGEKPIFTRIIGGLDADVYTIEHGRRIKIYDNKSSTSKDVVVKRGGAHIKKSNIYTHNTYDFNKTINKVNSIIPSIGFNPDDGMLIGVQDTYIVKGFKNDPFHRKHVLKAGYYFATSGFDFNYSGEFANSLGKWNLQLGLHFTSDNYAQNFFGLGNETVNNDDTEVLELDYNRVKTGIAQVNVGIVKDNDYGSRLAFKTFAERIEVDATADRFIVQDYVPSSANFFDNKYFAGLEGNYNYTNADNPANPTKGMLFDMTLGTRMNLEDTERIYGYLMPKLGFYNTLTRNKKLVLKTLLQSQINIGDSFEFYQGATLGANSGLRGFRNERFTGESSLVGTADLRYSFNRIKTGLLPVQLGVFVGGDVGRVWLDNEISDTWHTDVGGGLWINAVDMISGQLSAFNSDEGMRISFGFGVSF